MNISRTHLAWLGFGCFSILLGGMALLKSHTLHVSFHDLGLFQNNIYNIGVHGQWWRAFDGHVQPLLLVYGVIYNVLGNWAAGFLLASQAVLLSLPVIGLFKRFGAVAALAYGLYFPIWYGALFDFHIDHLAVVALFLFLFFDHGGRYRLAAFAAASLVLIKEPFALQTIACGLYLGVFRKKYVMMSVLSLIGASWFLWSIRIVLPGITLGSEAGALTGGGAYTWMGPDLPSMLVFLLTHPFEVLSEIAHTPRKLLYLGTLLGALGLIPLLAPRYLIIALPPIAISLLSQLDNYYGYKYHYSLGAVPPLIFAFAIGLPKFKRLLHKIGFKRSVPGFVLGGLVAAHVALSPSPISRLFWTDKLWQYGYSAYYQTENDLALKKAIRTYIPEGYDIVVSVQNTIVSPYLSERNHMMVFPNGILQPFTLNSTDNVSPIRLVKKQGPFPVKLFSADYVVVDLNRPLYIGDKGCEWFYGKCTDDEFVKKFKDILANANEAYKTLYSKDGIIILQKNGAN